MNRATLNAHRHRWRPGGIGIILVVTTLFWGLLAIAQGEPEGAGISPQFLQSALKDLGHYRGRVDGNAGPKTRTAVARWQKSAGFPATGTLSDEQEMELIRQSAAAGPAAAMDLLSSLDASGVPDEGRSGLTGEPPPLFEANGVPDEGTSDLTGEPPPSLEANGVPDEGTSDLTGEPPPPSDSERIHTLEQTIDGLDQSMKAATEGIDNNQQIIVNLGERLGAELKRMDPIAQRLDSLGEQIEQTTEVVERQQTRIEDNSVKLYETLIGIDSAKQDLEGLRRSRQPVAEEDQPPTVGSMDDANLRLLLSVALCMLVPFAAMLYQGNFGTVAPGANAPAAMANHPAPAAWIVAAWFGGGVGYYLVGVGIMFGTSQAGWVGAPGHFVSELLMSAPVDVAPELLSLVLSQILLAGIVSIIVCSGAVERLSPWGHLFVALLVGGLVYPLFGHWTSTSAILPEQYGWLSSAGFTYSAGTAGVALLGGVTALFLARGLDRIGRRAQETQHEPAARGAAGSVLLWIAWPGVIIAASADTPSLPVLLLSASMMIAAAGLSVLVFDGLFSTDSHWQQRIPGAALTGLVCAPGAYASASTSELLLLGAAAGLSYTLLMRPWSKRPVAGIELAVTLAVGGFWGTLGATLFGPDGFLFVRSIDSILPQLQGLGAALVLAAIAGQLLAWPTRRIALLKASS